MEQIVQQQQPVQPPAYQPTLQRSRSNRSIKSNTSDEEFKLSKPPMPRKQSSYAPQLNRSDSEADAETLYDIRASMQMSKAGSTAE